jgi:hypothetical protein
MILYQYIRAIAIKILEPEKALPASTDAGYNLVFTPSIQSGNIES